MQALVGQRYGPIRELPSTICANDFERIRVALSSRRGRDLKHSIPLLYAYYELDENSVDPEQIYLLTNRKSVSSPQAIVDPADVCSSNNNNTLKL